jgi:hypothetical protein
MDFFKPEVKKIQYNHILSESGEKEPSNELFLQVKPSDVNVVLNHLFLHRKKQLNSFKNSIIL